MSISAMMAHSRDKKEKRRSPHRPGEACPNEDVEEEEEERRGGGLRWEEIDEEEEVETLE